MLFLVDNLMKWGTTCFFEYQFVKEDWNEVLLKCNICWKIGSWDYELDWAKQNLQKSVVVVPLRISRCAKILDRTMSLESVQKIILYILFSLLNIHRLQRTKFWTPAVKTNPILYNWKLVLFDNNTNHICLMNQYFWRFVKKPKPLSKKIQ